MSSEPQRHSPTSDEMQRFSATGRPFQAPSKSDKMAMTMQSVNNAESYGHGPANLLPVRYTDDSLIPVPVMRSEDIGKPAKKEKKSFFSSRRKSENTNFVMKEIPRGEYLKHYAKDDSGKYIGTEEPASDCILRGEDLDYYRGKGNLDYRHEIDSVKKASEDKDSVIR
jgi:hypothetical protein